MSAREDEYEEFAGPAETSFQGVVRGPGATLERAIHAAARAAAQAGYAGRSFTVTFVEIEPQEYNQWVRAYRVVITLAGESS
ncbi:MAG TPA: hypothetical protein VI503_04670 [Gaiellaceae bacterium]|nr:hypothetical protein [Gaiellaceae bacterium]